MSSSRSSSTSSWAERKLARQRQMEMMEAVASGTAPTMELDTLDDDLYYSDRAGTGGGAGTVDFEQNIRPHAFADVSVQPYIRGTRSGGDGSSSGLTTGGAVPSAEIFERPQVPTTLHGVNLMDHRTGVYREPTTFTENVSLALTSVRDLFGRPELYDASPSDDYIGQGGPGGGGTGGTLPRGKKRWNTVRAACTNLCHRYSTWLVVAAIVLIFVVVVTSVMSVVRPMERRQFHQNVVRHGSISEQITNSGVSSPAALQNTSSPEYHALRWIAYSDAGRVSPTDPGALVRYALAVFFYSSYQSYMLEAGTQAPITSADNTQWEGVPNPGWRRKDYWMTNTGYCQWYGIVCKMRQDPVTGEYQSQYDANGEIISFDLSNNQVYGTIPPEFKAMTNLTHFGLSQNHLTGSFPPQLGRMYLLQSLVLSDNMLSGSIPTWIGYLEGVQDLELNNNKFTGTIPTELGNLFQVQTLGLQANLLKGNIPDLSNCKVLRQIDISDNLLDGTLPATLGNVTTLTDINLSNNSLVGTLPVSWSNLAHLLNLDLDDNRLTGPLDPTLAASLMRLQNVNLQQNQFTGTLPSGMSRWSNLRTLTLNNNRFNGTLPAWPAYFNVQSIQLSNNQLTGELPHNWANMTALQTLWLDHNHFNGTLPADLALASSLKVVYLNNNDLTGRFPSDYGNMYNLESMRIDYNQMSGFITTSMCSLEKLHHLRALSADCKTGNIRCNCCYCR